MIIEHLEAELEAVRKLRASLYDLELELGEHIAALVRDNLPPDRMRVFRALMTVFRDQLAWRKVYDVGHPSQPPKYDSVYWAGVEALENIDG